MPRYISFLKGVGGSSPFKTTHEVYLVLFRNNINININMNTQWKCGMKTILIAKERGLEQCTE